MFITTVPPESLPVPLLPLPELLSDFGLLLEELLSDFGLLLGELLSDFGLLLEELLSDFDSLLEELLSDFDSLLEELFLFSFEFWSEAEPPVFELPSELEALPPDEPVHEFEKLSPFEVDELLSPDCEPEPEELSELLPLFF